MFDCFFWGTVWWEVLTVLAASCYLARSWVSIFFWTETSRKESKLQLIECWFPKLRVTGRQRCVTTSSKRSHSMATFLRWKKCKKIRRKCKKCGKMRKKTNKCKKNAKKNANPKKKTKKNATQPEQQKQKTKKTKGKKGTHHWTAWRHLKKMQHSCHQGNICPLAKLVP